MDVPLDLSTLFETNLVKLDVRILRRLNARKYPAVPAMIDHMGKLSTEAQNLKRTLTSYDKVVDSDGQQALYILWDRGDKPNHSRLLGMLKVGQKQLYLYNKEGRCFQCDALCILDFYVYTSIQRKGFGRVLYDFMLQNEGLHPAAVAIDKPSDSLLAFMVKHYNLTDPIWQVTRYAVYPDFFKLQESGHLHQAADDLQPAPQSEKIPRAQNRTQVDYLGQIGGGHGGIATRQQTASSTPRQSHQNTPRTVAPYHQGPPPPSRSPNHHVEPVHPSAHQVDHVGEQMSNMNLGTQYVEIVHHEQTNIAARPVHGDGGVVHNVTIQHHQTPAPIQNVQSPSPQANAAGSRRAREEISAHQRMINNMGHQSWW